MIGIGWIIPLLPYPNALEKQPSGLEGPRSTSGNEASLHGRSSAKNCDYYDGCNDKLEASKPKGTRNMVPERIQRLKVTSK